MSAAADRTESAIIAKKKRRRRNGKVKVNAAAKATAMRR